MVFHPHLILTFLSRNITDFSLIIPTTANHTSTNTEPRMTYSFNFLPSIMGKFFTNVVVRPQQNKSNSNETLTYDENEI